MALLEQINDFLWGLPLIILLMGTHIYFTFKLRFPQRNLFRAIRLSLYSAEDKPSDAESFPVEDTSLVGKPASAKKASTAHKVKTARNLSPFSAHWPPPWARETSSVSQPPSLWAAPAPFSGAGSPGFWGWPPPTANAT